MTMPAKENGVRQRPEIEWQSERYKNRELVGRGGWADVYKVYDTLLKREMALKVFNPGPVQQRQLLEEGRTIEDIVGRHAGFFDAPNLVSRWPDTVTDETGKKIYVLETELFPKTLAEVVDGLTLDEIVSYATDIAAGIEQYHDHFEEAHRDLKLENIVVEGGRLRLNDLESGEMTTTIAQGEAKIGRGHVYTRAPRMFVDGEGTSRTVDFYGFASILKRHFTPTYLLECTLEGMSEAEQRSYMAKLHKDKNLLVATIRADEGFAAIPKAYQDLIIKTATVDSFGPKEPISILTEWLHEANEQHEAYEHAEKEALEKAAKEAKDRKWRPWRRAAIAAVMVLAGIGAVSTYNYIKRHSFDGIIELQTGERAKPISNPDKLVYAMEKVPDPANDYFYDSWMFHDSALMANIRNSQRTKYPVAFISPPVDTIKKMYYPVFDVEIQYPDALDTLTSIISQTASSMGIRLEPSGLQHRFEILADTTIHSYDEHKVLRGILQRTLSMHKMNGDTVNLPNVIFSALFGQTALLNVMNKEGSTRFGDYSAKIVNHASEGEEFFQGLYKKELMDMILWNVNRFAGRRVYLLQDSTRAGLASPSP